MRFTTVFSALFLLATGAHADIRSDLDAVENVGTLIGLAVGLADGGAILDMHARGIREKGQQAPVTTADVWHLGSISKSLTMVLLGTLVAEGRLDIDAPLPVLLPDIEGMDAGWNDVTLRDALEHRSGLPENFGIRVMMEEAADEALRPALRAAALATVLAKPPGERDFLYSNIGYTLAGHVVENITGQTWEQAMRDRVFAPLTLQTAGFGAPKGAARHDQPVGHANFFGLWQKPVSPFDSAADNTPIIGPAGTVHMSLPDLLAYGQALLHMAQGQDDVLPADIFATLTTARQGNYAGGLITGRSDAVAGRFIWHNGSNTMWYAILVVLPEKNLVIAVTVNQDGAFVRDTVWTIIKQIADRQPRP